MLICTYAVGIPSATPVYLASKGINNWCQGECDFAQQPQLQLAPDQCFLQIKPGDRLDTGDEFKLIIPNFGAKAAAKTYADRMDAKANHVDGLHVDRRFDFDPKTGHFWLLACNHLVARQGYWNQNNIYDSRGGGLPYRLS